VKVLRVKLCESAEPDFVSSFCLNDFQFLFSAREHPSFGLRTSTNLHYIKRISQFSRSPSSTDVFISGHEGVISTLNVEVAISRSTFCFLLLVKKDMYEKLYS